MTSGRGYGPRRDEGTNRQDRRRSTDQAAKAGELVRLKRVAGKEILDQEGLAELKSGTGRGLKFLSV